MVFKVKPRGHQPFSECLHLHFAVEQWEDTHLAYVKHKGFCCLTGTMEQCPKPAPCFFFLYQDGCNSQQNAYYTNGCGRRTLRYIGQQQMFAGAVDLEHKDNARITVTYQASRDEGSLGIHHQNGVEQEKYEVLQ